MPRINRNGRIFHPDEVRAGALDSFVPAGGSPAQLAAARLTDAGYRPDDPPSHWWTGPNGERFRGRAAALEDLETVGL